MRKLVEVKLPPLDGQIFVWASYHGVMSRTCYYHGGVGKHYLEDTAEWVEDDSSDWDDEVDAKYFIAKWQTKKCR